MSEYKANYWQSDQVSPSEFKESINRNLRSAMQTGFNKNSKVKYNSEADCIDVSFDCKEFGINMRNSDKLFDDIFNEEYVESQTFSTSFIYHELLTKIMDRCDGDFENLGRGMTSDIIWRIARYIGASEKISQANFNSTDDSIWEMIHNE